MSNPTTARGERLPSPWGTVVLVIALTTSLLGACSGGVEQESSEQEDPEQVQRPASRDESPFEDQGVQEGESLPELTVRTLGGEEVALSTAWKERPALIVTCSLTCPIARENQPTVEEIADRFGDEIEVVMLYTIEAHPVNDPSPYRDEEWVTDENREAEILERQPRSFEQRASLARAYADRLDVNRPILLDTMGNEAWEALGGGPNMGLLVRADGTLAVKHGWFDGETMVGSIEHFLASSPSADEDRQR